MSSARPRSGCRLSDRLEQADLRCPGPGLEATEKGDRFGNRARHDNVGAASHARLTRSSTSRGRRTESAGRPWTSSGPGHHGKSRRAATPSLMNRTNPALLRQDRREDASRLGRDTRATCRATTACRSLGQHALVDRQERRLLRLAEAFVSPDQGGHLFRGASAIRIIVVLSAEQARLDEERLGGYVQRFGDQLGHAD